MHSSLAQPLCVQECDMYYIVNFWFIAKVYPTNVNWRKPIQVSDENCCIHLRDISSIFIFLSKKWKISTTYHDKVEQQEEDDRSSLLVCFERLLLTGRQMNDATVRGLQRLMIYWKKHFPNLLSYFNWISFSEELMSRKVYTVLCKIHYLHISKCIYRYR